MNRGLLQQVATPGDLYEFPNSRFVADFIGQVNMFEGRLAVDEPHRAVVKTAELPTPVFLDHGVSGARDATVWVALRPEKIQLHKRADDRQEPVMDDAPAEHNIAPGWVRHMTYLGSESVYEVELPGGRMVRVLRANLTRWDQEDFAWGEPVWLSWHACSPAVLLS
jgi:spermidine/putrescine transport system ATP-binding protein